MIALSIPISSPTRADTFPPPLMRFLRSNIGSRSRGRSRSSPIFYIRSRRNAEITQEPSSPRVTCMGQVKSKARKSGSAAVNRRRRCWLAKKALFFGKISSRFYSQRKVLRRFFCKWVLFLRSDYCKKVDVEENSRRAHANHKSENLVEFYSEKYENFGGGIQESERNFLSDCSPPPKNALILTGCRSAPYRSSSLGGRFWISPLAENDEKAEELQKPSENEEEDSRIGQEISQKLENSEDNCEDFKGIVGGGIRPLLLTRCKSVPAKRGERLNPETTLISGCKED